MIPHKNPPRMQAAIRIKICGLGRAVEIAWANRLLPDYVGFVFAESRRRVDPYVAQALIRQLDPRIAAVGVFVNEATDQVANIAAVCGLRVVQLHGGETEDYISLLRHQLPPEIRIWKAYRIKETQDVSRFLADAGNRLADGYLLDAWHPGQAGGTGEVFDWDLLRTVTNPYLLAGGLTPQNVSSAVQALHPWGIDVSSGVETDGRKDETKMAAFVKAVREVDSEWIQERWP